ncbi:MAG TPA: glycosyltransferase [Caulobacteraceae bacterium]|jgi:hopene-associated glycosyltransferase HpnB
MTFGVTLGMTLAANWTLILAAMSAGAWVALLAFRGGFWLCRERDDVGEPKAPASWPTVVAVVPARNEADVVALAVGSLRRQDYLGAFRIILVDDGSTDGTADRALETAGKHPLEVIAGAPLERGWTGKLWAQNQGVARAAALEPAYLWLTDADIFHDPATLRRLVGRAEAGGLVLTSLMARLTVRSGWERMLIPPFVFFFDMLFPFAWVNNPRRKTAAAAGGCMLVNTSALQAAGGLAAIRGRIIDDCALAEILKRRGPIWLGLTRRIQSLRPYQGLNEIGAMVARSAYAQLGYSPVVLAGVVLAMGLVFAAPALIAIFDHGPAKWLALATWIAMIFAMRPILRLYRIWVMWGVALPLAGALYGVFTLVSAVQSWRGRGGVWKGRAQDAPSLAT